MQIAVAGWVATTCIVVVVVVGVGGVGDMETRWRRVGGGRW
jgi:hypothetical protein